MLCFRIAVIAWASIWLGGCASPYVRVAPPDPGRTYQPMSVAHALAYSRAYHDAYREKVIEFGDNERIATNGLVTLGAVLLGLSMAKAHSSAIQGVTLIGGTAYTLGVLSNDKRRGMIYVAGMKALQCANDAASPLNLTQDTVRDITDQMEGVKRASEDVGPRIGGAEAALLMLAQAGIASDTARQATREAVEAAAAAIERSSQAYTAGGQLLLKHRQAGDQLRNAVHQIDSAVLDELRGTEGSIQAVPAILAQLAGNNSIFAGSLPATTTASNQVGATESPHGATVRNRLKNPNIQPDWQLQANFAAAMSALKASAVLLNGRTDRLTGIVRAIEGTVPVDRLKSCKVEGIQTAMVAAPSSLVFEAGKPGTQMISLKGGKPGYMAQFVQSSHPGLAVDPPSPFLRSDIIAVSSTKELAASSTSYQLIVRDSADQIQVIPIKVVEKSSTAPTTPTEKRTSRGAAPTLAAKADPVVALLMKSSPVEAAAGISVTLTSAVARADGSFEVFYRPPVGSAVTSEQVRVAIALKMKNQTGSSLQIVAVQEPVGRLNTEKDGRPSSSGFFGPVVGGLGSKEIIKIQQILCMSERDAIGRWDIRTQQALEKDRGKREGGTKNIPQGFLNETELALIRDRTSDEKSRICKIR